MAAVRDEIEDLHALADECREWGCEPHDELTEEEVRAVAGEFKRLADKLDAIAKRLTEQRLHRDGQP